MIAARGLELTRTDGFGTVAQCRVVDHPRPRSGSALQLAPVPTWILAPATSASWLAVAIAANGLVYALAATVTHLAVLTARRPRAGVPPVLCAVGLVPRVLSLSWLGRLAGRP